MTTIVPALLLLAAGQAPADPPKPPTPPLPTPPYGYKTVTQPPKPTTTVAPPKPAGPPTVDELIAQALQSNPDIRVAQAEVEVAQAKLAQIKLVTAQKVAAAHAGLDASRMGMEAIVAQFEGVKRQERNGVVSKTEVLNLQALVAKAKAEVAVAEAALRTATGTNPAGFATTFPFSVNLPGGQTGMFMLDGTVSGGQAQTFTFNPANLLTRNWDTSGINYRMVVDATAVAPGSSADKLRAALDTVVKMDETKGDLKTVLTALLAKVGLKMMIRVPMEADPAMLGSAPKLTLQAGELTLAGWLQLVRDDAAPRVRPLNETGNELYDLYVREYGLLFAEKKAAPPGAITVQDLLAQTRAAKPAAEEKKPK